MLDLIIKNAVVLTMKGKGIGLIQDGAVGVKGNTITCVDDSTTLTKMYNAKRTIDASGKILMPGLINAHCHSYYGTLTRGVLTDLEFYLEQGLAAYMDTMDIRKEIISCKAFLLEGIKTGTTTYGDLGSNYDVLASIHEEMGVRARLSESMREMPWDISEFLGGEYVFDRKYAEPSIKVMNTLLDKYGTDPNDRISAMVSFQALDYVTDQLVLELKEVARNHKAMIHTHLAQSTYECDQVEKRFGMRPVDMFEKLGILNENTLAAHLVYNTKAENEKAAKSGLNFVSCPNSWGEVGCIPPMAQYLYHNGSVGMGSDEASYTGVSAFFDMKSGHLSANVDAFNNHVPNVTLSMVLRAHTVGSAKVLGMEKQIGSLEPGKKADMIIIDPNVINMLPILISPLTNIPQNLVCTAMGNEVETVIIDGKIIMEDRLVKTADEEKIMRETQAAAEEAAKDAAAYYEKLPEAEVLIRQRWFEET